MANPNLCIIGPDGKFRDLNSFVDALVAMGTERPEAIDRIKKDNREKLISFGCESDQLQEQGFAFMLSLSLQQTFNSWSNEEEGSSGISARALLSEATTPGAVLTLVGLLKAHPDAKASGNLNVSYSNPTRSSGARR